MNKKTSLSKTIEWQAPEYEFYKKTTDWYWAVGIITAAASLSAALLHNFLFAILALLAGFSIALYGAKKPDIVSFSIMPDGIHIKNRVYLYENLKKFWINCDAQGKKELIIESKKTLMPPITILMENTDPQKTRACLLKYLKEEKIEEPLTTTLAKLLGF
ncbi:hypothetical protein KJ934_01025 [Patescibacteria group bacterium]|nr:hypothetical protein [Patescibacteria group bacterium]MBU4353636.1 hypothetical protein [Patescibacteria group bacterium]MBU4476987.1 hypothetical protein [Patescibacteria group bacterium]MCG2699155.1 hypothetical protein [Candidatus Parcubacteria bacterium]